MDRGNVILPNRMDSENDIIEEVTTWESITTNKDSDALTSEEDVSDVDGLEQIHWSDVWDCLVEVENETNVSAP